MKKFQAEKLIDNLKRDVEKILDCAIFFKGQKQALLLQPAPQKWSVAQVLEHLNRYGQYYLPAIDKAVSINNTSRSAWFMPGFLGDYFTNSMKPKSPFEIKGNMKTMKSYNPDNSLDADAVLNEFIEQQKKLLQLLELSKQRDLNAIRIPITVSKLIKLKLGDTFRFFIAHEQRHMIQARNALIANGVATDRFPVIVESR